MATLAECKKLHFHFLPQYFLQTLCRASSVRHPAAIRSLAYPHRSMDKPDLITIQ